MSVDARRPGFTLVELLVVVAVIALLISILLPSIESAREQARTVVCSTRMHDMFTGINNYANQYEDWLPGSPGTTGLELQVKGRDAPPIELIGREVPGIPVQNWDWQTPLAAYGMDYEGLPDDRVERWTMIREMELFHCPSNNYLVPPYPANAFAQGWTIMLLNSYSTIREFMYFGSVLPGQSDPDSLHIPSGWDVDTPVGYTPRLTRVERPAGKALVVDGSRFMRADLPSPDFDINYEASYGGAFACAGPPSSYSRAFINPVDIDPEQHDRQWDQKAYRHGSSGEFGLNVLHFDGHANRMGKTEAIEALDLWYPSGTKVGIQEFDGTGGSDPVAKPRAVMELQKRTPDPDGPSQGLYTIF